MNSLNKPLRPDAEKVLHQLYDGRPAELVNTRALWLLEKVGLVEWASDYYGRVISDAGRAYVENEGEIA